MAAVILPIVLVLTTTKTIFVFDAVLSPGGGYVARAAQTIQSPRSHASAALSASSPRQRVKGSTRAGASKISNLHFRLLSMHMIPIVGQAAGAAKYLLPVSDTSCVVTHRIMLGLVILFDASVVVFLLAKANVTNANRTLTCLEKGITWWSRFYGWVYLPLVAVLLGTSFPGSANHEEKFCYNGITTESSITTTTGSDLTTSENARSFGINNVLLIVQFALLLLVFIKPMLARVEGTQSGGAVYRRVVLRNVICTAGIIASYAITTLIVVIALLRESTHNNKSAQIGDVGLAINSLGTLCLTEIALPLGFRSCIKACFTVTATSTGIQAAGKTAIAGTTSQKTAATGTAGAITIKKIVPIEELPPSVP